MYYAHLTRKQRYQIERLIQEGVPSSQIARKLGVHRSTVYRERRRGARAGDRYRAALAQLAAERRIRRSAANCGRKPAALWRAVARQLRRDWSPEQICGRARLLGKPSVSAPAIYAWIRRQGTRGKGLLRHLRYAWRRQQRQLNPWPVWRKLPRPSIHQRPQEARDRRQLGHWEGDTMRGSARSTHHLLALVERTSRYLVLRRPSRRPVLSAAVARSVVKGLEPLKAKSITFDNGAEFARYEQIQADLACPVFFADPRSPNQRATCENTIGLVRQYLPKGVDLSRVGTAQVARIEKRINQRPRHCLGFRTSSEVLFNKLPDVALRT